MIITIYAIGYYCPTPSFTLIPSSNYGTLKKMIILTRHGDRENIVRSLNESICYDENNNRKQCELSQLTEKGKQRLNQFGKDIRDYLIKNDISIETMKYTIESTNKERTIQSAQSFIQGVFQRNVSMNEIHIEKEKYETNLYIEDEYLNLSKEDYEEMIHTIPSIVYNSVKRLEHLLEEKQKELSILMKISYLYDYLAVKECLNTLEDQYKQDFTILHEYLIFRWNRYYQQESSKRETQQLRKQLKEYLIDSLKCENEKCSFESDFNFHFISGHDITLYFFLRSLGLNDVSFAPYGSSVIIEVIEKENQLYCRLSFNSKVIRLCNEEKLCVFNEFISYFD